MRAHYVSVRLAGEEMERSVVEIQIWMDGPI
jgi:hypothetical protein